MTPILLFHSLLQLISQAQFAVSYHPKHRKKVLERRKDAIIVQDLQVKCRKQLGVLITHTFLLANSQMGLTETCTLQHSFHQHLGSLQSKNSFM